MWWYLPSWGNHWILEWTMASLFLFLSYVYVYISVVASFMFALWRRSEEGTRAKRTQEKQKDLVFRHLHLSMGAISYYYLVAISIAKKGTDDRWWTINAYVVLLSKLHTSTFLHCFKSRYWSISCSINAQYFKPPNLIMRQWASWNLAFLYLSACKKFSYYCIIDRVSVIRKMELEDYCYSHAFFNLTTQSVTSFIYPVCTKTPAHKWMFSCGFLNATAAS